MVELEQRLREYDEKFVRLESRQDRIEEKQAKMDDTQQQQAIQFAETKVYVKEIYKKMDGIAVAVDSLKISSSRSREDFKDSIHDARVAAKDAVNEAVIAAKDAVNEAAKIAKTATDEVKTTGGKEWIEFFKKWFWLMAAAGIGYLAKNVHF